MSWAVALNAGGRFFAAMIVVDRAKEWTGCSKDEKSNLFAVGYAKYEVGESEMMPPMCAALARL